MNALSSCAGASGHGALRVTVSEFLAPSAGPNKRKRRPAGTPDPGAEVVALSPRTLMESDRYVCEICNQGFQRDQNLQMHRRRHKVPWKLLKKPISVVTNRRVYICPERSCLHHDPTHALGDLVGIKKHYRRKHCSEKQWKCVKCSKRYAVQSDYKAHLKTCGTRGHCCDCGRVFSRVESFIEHQDTCSAVKRKLTTHKSSLHQSIERLIATESPSDHSSSDTTVIINSTKLMDEALPREGHVALPSWLVTAERPSELELLQRLPEARKGQVKLDGIHEDLHAPCLRLSIGPAAAASSAAGIAASCLSSHPSLDVDSSSIISSDVARVETWTTGVILQNSSAIGSDLGLSISGATTVLSNFLAPATSTGCLDSCREIVTNFNPCSESTSSDHEDHSWRRTQAFTSEGQSYSLAS